MANVPGLNVGGTGTSATQAPGALPVVASNGIAFAFSAVGTSGYFVRSGGTGVPTFFNLFATANTWTTRQEFTGGPASVRLKSGGGGVDAAYLDFCPRDATPTVVGGLIGFFGAGSDDINLINQIASGDIHIRTTSGNIFFQHDTFAPGAGGSATGVLAVQNCATPPTANPSGGAFWYVENGASKVRGSSGNIITFGPAEPHCATCGHDFVLEWERPEEALHVAVCVPCLIDEIGTHLPQLNRTRFAVPKARGAV